MCNSFFRPFIKTFLFPCEMNNYVSFCLFCFLLLFFLFCLFFLKPVQFEGYDCFNISHIILQCAMHV